MTSPLPSSKNAANHLHSLDALRGLAALSVVFWHWQHFFYHGTHEGPFDKIRQPLYFYPFTLFYSEGWRAVDLFFCLSGFIFYWLYAQKIQARKTSLKDFAILRFSRLYPLHFLTLCAVAAGQAFMLHRFGSFFIYPNNNLYHFLLNVMFISSWGFQHGDSFNGPSWSVSIEILLYCIFFVTCFVNLRRTWQLAMFTLLGYVLMYSGRNEMIARGVVSFFIGGIAYEIFVKLTQRNLSKRTIQCLGLATVALWLFIPFNEHHDLLFHGFTHALSITKISFPGSTTVGQLCHQIDLRLFDLILYPAIIVTLALWESRGGKLGRHISWLGDVSYSSYLIHFPLQMVFAAVTMSYAIPNTFFYSIKSLALFVAVLIPLSLCSYHFFERPCQSAIRQFLLPKKP